MRKIAVAGAGLGGLAAAFNLAKQGYDVTVFESAQREHLGHDWHDCIGVAGIGEVGFALPDASVFTPFMPMAYHSPSGKIRLCPPMVKGSANIKYIDRKVLVAHLLAQTEQAGATLRFGTPVTKPIVQGNTVKGFYYCENGVEKECLADLVIDAAGIDSPLRSNLPAVCGIQKTIDDQNTLYVYRAYYNKVDSRVSSPRYNVHFYHCGRKSMDWLVCMDDYVDIMLGSFGPVTKGQIEEALSDFRKQYPFTGTEILRGGQIKKIPLQKPLSMLVCNGYALTGDSASMVYGLSGSGMNAALHSGKLLADTVVKAGNNSFDISALWNYQYRYFKKEGFSQLGEETLKNFLLGAGEKGLNGLFDKRFITEREMAGSGRKYNTRELLQKGAALLSAPAAIVPGIEMLKANGAVKKAKALLPEHYDPAAVSLWQKVYETI